MGMFEVNLVLLVKCVEFVCDYFVSKGVDFVMLVIEGVGFKDLKNFVKFNVDENCCVEIGCK